MSRCRDRRSEWWQQKETNAKQMPKHRQRKKKNQLLHFYPITSLQDFTAAKTTYTKCKSHTVCLEKQHFPQRNTFSGKQKKSTVRANTRGAEGEQVPHIRAYDLTQRSYLFTQTLSQAKNQRLQCSGVHCWLLHIEPCPRHRVTTTHLQVSLSRTHLVTRTKSLRV